MLDSLPDYDERYQPDTRPPPSHHQWITWSHLLMTCDFIFLLYIKKNNYFFKTISIQTSDSNSLFVIDISNAHRYIRSSFNFTSRWRCSQPSSNFIFTLRRRRQVNLAGAVKKKIIISNHSSSDSIHHLGTSPSDRIW